jgi:hypothetical protein
MNFDQMSPYELGLTSNKMAIPHLRRFLASGSLNEKRLAASAINKLSTECQNDCNSAIPELLSCIQKHPHTQTRQYALKACCNLQLSCDLYIYFKEIAETDEKYYNREIATELLQLISQDGNSIKFKKNAIKKEFVLLVNSIKNGQNCVAGREIIRHGNQLQLGPWIRPVSDHDHGAVSTSEMLLENQEIPEFLDLLEIEVSENANDPTQPENWHLCSEKKWKKTGVFQLKSVFDHFIENPSNLWKGNCCKLDRIDTAGYMGNGFNSSICIIKPEFFVMEIFTTYNVFEGRQQKRRRGKFSYNGETYDLAITDPDIDKKYFKPFPGNNDGIKQIPLNPEKCLLCISLAPEFNGFHYKLIAKVIEGE